MMQGSQQLETSVIGQAVSEQLKKKLLEITEQNKTLVAQVENAEGKELVIVVQKDPSITQDQIVATDNDQYTLMLSHQTIVTIAASIALPTAGYIDSGIGHAAGIEVGEKAAQLAKEELTKLGENPTTANRKDSGLENVSFAKLFVNDEVNDLAHKAAEKLCQETINLSAKQGGVYDAILAGGATIAAIELLNLIGLGVQYTAPSVKEFFKNYITTPIYNYFKESREAKLRVLAAKLDKEEEEAQLQLASKDAEKVDALVSQLKDLSIGDDWILVGMGGGENKVVTFSKITTVEQPKNDEKEEKKPTRSLSV